MTTEDMLRNARNKFGFYTFDADSLADFMKAVAADKRKPLAQIVRNGIDLIRQLEREKYEIAHNLDATVFVFKHTTGEIVATYASGYANLKADPSYQQVASIEPRLWIQAHYAEVSEPS